MTKHVLEVVEFKLNQNAKDADFLAEVAKSESFVSSMNGFIGRDTVKNQEGVWLDVVKWQSMDDALKASEKFNGAPEVGGFMQLIDMQSVKMSHYDIENAM